MTDDRNDEAVTVARLLAQEAAELDRLGWPKTGILRQAARLLLEVPDHTTTYVADDIDERDRCPGCADPIDQPATGRRRTWCSERCRSQARRR